MTSKLLSTYKQKIKELKLIPAGGGCFEVKVNGELIYSKLKTGKFPDEQSILEAVGMSGNGAQHQDRAVAKSK